MEPVYEEKILELKKDAFLKWQCVYYCGKPITVLEVMQFYAYVRGGIHLDKGEKKYEYVRQAFETIIINGSSILDQTMRGIVQVVLATLNKFKDQLLN